MSTDSRSNKHSVQEIKNFRLSGRLVEALQAVTAALGRNPADVALKAEAVRVLLLSGQTETAVQMHQSIDDKALSPNNLETEVLVRLALQLGRRDLVQDLPPVEAPSWLVAIQAGGEDPALAWDLQDLTVQVAGGPSVYIFTSACPHCRHVSPQQVNTNLLVARSSLCPACFGHVRLTYRGILAFLQERHPDLLTRRDENTDWDMIEQVRPRLLGLEEAPQVVRRLGQEYQFLLNEIITRRLLAGDGASS